MKVIVVGGTGTIGSAVVNELGKRHEVISVGYSHSDITCDISDANSIKEMYRAIGDFDAVVSATGKVHSLIWKRRFLSMIYPFAGC